MWTWKFLNLERKSCGFKNIWIRVDWASEWIGCTEHNLNTRGWTFYHLIPRGLTIYHVKLVQSIALLEQKRFDLRSLSPALRNLWLFLVLYFGGKADVKLGRFISLPPPREFCFLACHTEIQKDLDLKWLQLCVFIHLMFGYLHQCSNATVLKMLLYFLSFLPDKAAACATFRAAFNAQPQNWTLLDCNIECCTGHNCNNQSVTVAPPSTASTPTPSTPTSEPHGNSWCNMSKTRASMKPEFLTCLLKWKLWLHE